MQDKGSKGRSSFISPFLFRPPSPHKVDSTKTSFWLCNLSDRANINLPRTFVKNVSDSEANLYHGPPSACRLSDTAQCIDVIIQLLLSRWSSPSHFCAFRHLPRILGLTMDPLGSVESPQKLHLGLHCCQCRVHGVASLSSISKSTKKLPMRIGLIRPWSWALSLERLVT